MILIFGFLLVLGGSVRAREECDYDEFQDCMRQVLVMNDEEVFNIISEDQMKEVCQSKWPTIQCVNNFIENCMKKGEKDLYDATMGGKLKVVEEMCTDGSRINKGLLEHMDCFEEAQDEINFCHEKFQESQKALEKANMLERLKVFYSCCAFEWHRNCLAKTARMKCDDKASDYLYYVTTVLFGQAMNKICSTSYSSCHGLHGVDQSEIDEQYNELHNSSTSWNVASQIIPLLLLVSILLVHTKAKLLL